MYNLSPEEQQRQANAWAVQGKGRSIRRIHEDDQGNFLGYSDTGWDPHLIDQSLAKSHAISDQFGSMANWRDQGSPSYEWQSYMPNPNGGARSSSGFGGNSMGNAGAGHSSYGGVSAVNPQAGQANELDAFRRYEDAAYADAMRRLQPAHAQQDRQFDQAMIDRGHAPGSGAGYSQAYRDKEMAQAEGLENAAFGAMQFGLGAQNQSFQQDHARSALANALLQAQWQKELGWGNINLGQDRLSEQGRQFDAGLGERQRQYDLGLGQSYDFFYDNLANNQYQFDSQMDYNLWDRGNYWDFAYDRANSSDYFGAWDRDYRSQQDFMDFFGRMFGGSPGNAHLNAPYYPQPGSRDDWSWIFG